MSNTMTMANTGSSPPEGLAELRTDPIFLSQFLRLPLQKIDTIHPSPSELAAASAASPASTTAAATATATTPSSEVPPLQALPTIEAWPSFLAEVQKRLSNLDETEAYQHILPPAAHRAGDLPKATMLPTTYLWLIIQVWQPMNRLLNLEEEVSAGGHTAKGNLRGPLQIGDHLPQHESSQPKAMLPRQVVFRVDELDSGKVRGCVFVREPWLVDLRHLYGEDGKVSPSAAAADKGKTEAVEALQSLLAYMKSTRTKHGILTTYDHFIFVRAKSDDLSTIQLSPPLSAQDRTLTIFAALWHWARDVADQP